MNSCRNCKHAEWARTKNGRINPHQAGQCKWMKVVYLPASFTGYPRLTRGEPLVLNGGYIWRKEPREKCPTFQREDE